MPVASLMNRYSDHLLIKGPLTLSFKNNNIYSCLVLFFVEFQDSPGFRIADSTTIFDQNQVSLLVWALKGATLTTPWFF